MEFPDYVILAALTTAGTSVALALVACRHHLARALKALVAEPIRAASEGVRNIRALSLEIRAWHVVAIAFALATLISSLNHDAVNSGLPLLLALAGFAVLFAMAWSREALFLMALRDDDLPGRFDKPIWAFFLVATPPIGVLLFRSYRLAHWPEPRPKAARAARELA